MQLSLGIPNFGDWPGTDLRSLVDVARAADEAGVDRLVVSDHVVLGHNLDAYQWGRFPTAPEAPWLEPLSCLTAFAAVTRRARLSTGILIAPLRRPPLLAKTVATLDVLSGGRVDLGVGVGWQKEEYDALGLEFAARGRLLEDTIGACRALWSELPASYSSRSVTFTDVYCSPQPRQRPLPVWFSGTLNDRNLRRITSLGNGWIPIMGASLDDIRSGASLLRATTGREIDVQAPLSPVRRDDKTLDVAATMRQVGRLADAGVTNVYLNAATIGRTPAEAIELLPDVMREFSAGRDAVPGRRPAENRPRL
jgi:probable F420-dependent oxidoreductase